MKDAVGGTWLFQIALVFIVLFAGYLALSVNYSKAFKVKNEILSIIERNEGLTGNDETESFSDRNPSARGEIGAYLRENNHLVDGRCGTNDGSAYYSVGNNMNEGTYCVRKNCVKTNFEKAYYKVTVFFRFDLPYLGKLFTFKVQGETKQIPYPQDKLNCDTTLDKT